ncbi:MAG: hypothetical protein UV56_C0013G0010 [Candidatus Woesebacteria bacterium GW2011_GWC1_43_10b]|uniref:Uncharacterized protein n=2 Tax=Candidatus Woeseibacteriota TaxID=1752722 RepID=A0A0G1JCA4_9BACT|nr:MAG: hypothetical protein UV56_C0013G0010 [Candidatus Woesebacteria bacterium GW2011_GWC1_43_10b]KKT33024.1 MAG: hypothetical protein UW21_C0015G0005 [Candidatus Woesebacteria bacterium GW2011_GWB1_44_11b]
MSGTPEFGSPSPQDEAFDYLIKFEKEFKQKYPKNYQILLDFERAERELRQARRSVTNAGDLIALHLKYCEKMRAEILARKCVPKVLFLTSNLLIQRENNPDEFKHSLREMARGNYEYQGLTAKQHFYVLIAYDYDFDEPFYSNKTPSWY